MDVSQDVIIREEDCGADHGIVVADIREGKEEIETFRERLIGRFAVGDVTDPATGEVIVPEGKMMDLFDAEKIGAAGIQPGAAQRFELPLGSLACAPTATARTLPTATPCTMGESVGVIAAQSIGEPGTQLTMRTFHTGGIASAEDITQGLPRVEELFEAAARRRWRS